MLMSFSCLKQLKENHLHVIHFLHFLLVIMSLSCHDSNTSKKKMKKMKRSEKNVKYLTAHILGPVVQRSRRNAFTIITRVRLPSGLYSCFIFDADAHTSCLLFFLFLHLMNQMKKMKKNGMSMIARQEKMNKQQSIVCYNTCGLM